MPIPTGFAKVIPFWLLFHGKSGIFEGITSRKNKNSLKFIIITDNVGTFECKPPWIFIFPKFQANLSELDNSPKYF